MSVIEVNRRVPDRDAGSRTERFKARVRAEAIQSGMSADDEAEALRVRVAEWHATLKPADATQRWFVDEIARTTLKLDDSTRVERALRDLAAIRAETCWEADRRLEVEVIARKLSIRPSEVVASLRRSVQGCDFLIERWLMLAHVFDRDGAWTADQVSMAFDLLGTPAEVRGADPCLKLDDAGRPIEVFGNDASFARAEAARLRSIRENLLDLDEFDRSTTAAGLADASTLELRRFRRYVSSLQSRLKWCLKQLDLAKSEHPAQAPPTPVPSRIEKEPDIMHIPEQAMTLMAEPQVVSPSRVERKLDRAESRREAKLRKLERRRA